MVQRFCKKIIQTKEIRAVAHSNTVLSQLLAHINRHEFDQMAERHHQGQKFGSSSFSVDLKCKGIKSTLNDEG